MFSSVFVKISLLMYVYVPGRKRNPLAPLSPVSAGKTQKRPSQNESVHATIKDKSSLEKENVVPSKNDHKKFSSSKLLVRRLQDGMCVPWHSWWKHGYRITKYGTPNTSEFRSEQYGTANSDIESMQGASQCRAQS